MCALGTLSSQFLPVLGTTVEDGLLLSCPPLGSVSHRLQSLDAWSFCWTDQDRWPGSHCNKRPRQWRFVWQHCRSKTCLGSPLSTTVWSFFTPNLYRHLWSTAGR